MNPIVTGPVIRRVTRESASIFVVLGEFRMVKLNLFLNPLSAGSPIAEIEEAPKRIGKKLWVIVVTLENLSLVPGQNYYYNIKLHNGLDNITEDLDSLGFLEANNQILGLPLGYEAGHLPSFALPPGLEHLNIIHGSCRKPHGGGSDQLARLDDLIKAVHNDPLTRPHQLFLTGDQIYADDVDKNLLEKITTESIALLGIQESTNSSVKHGDLETNIDNRKQFLDNIKTITSDHKDYHLIFLAEFYCMYLFAWSGFPLTLEDLNKEHIFNAEEIITYKKSSDQLVTTALRSKLTIYASLITKVRRALANIPTFMIFDDHEITDDWYMYEDWKSDALNHDISKTIIRNGLIAYAIFQDWGNQPEKYQDNQSAFWQGVIYTEPENEDPSIKAFESGPESNNLNLFLGVDYQDPSIQHSWNYSLLFNDYQVIVLDSRTKRKTEKLTKLDINNASTKEIHYTKLIDENDFQTQINFDSQNNTNGTIRFTLIVSPAPVLGMSIAENLQTLVVKEMLVAGATTLDDEAWTGHPYTFNKLLDHLSNFHKVIILSGDVHYGFSNVCTYNNVEKGIVSSIVQLCSSALKNSEGKTELAAFVDFRLKHEEFVHYPATEINFGLFKHSDVSLTQLSSFQKLNPFLNHPVYDKDTVFFKKEDIADWKAIFKTPYEPNKNRASYRIDKIGLIDTEDTAKVIGTTNLGAVSFELAGNKITRVNHKLLYLSDRYVLYKIPINDN